MPKQTNTTTKHTSAHVKADTLSGGTVVHTVCDADGTIKFVTLYEAKANKRLANMLAAREDTLVDA